MRPCHACAQRTPLLLIIVLFSIFYPPLPPAASRGNTTEMVGPSVFALALTAPVIIYHAYLVRLQTYV